MTKICVLGAGSWGTTLAILLAENNHNVSLWTRKEEHANLINSEKENKKYLPGVTLSNKIISTHKLDEALMNTSMIITVLPCQHTREILKKIKPYFKDQIIVSASKGIETGTSKRMSEVIQEELGKDTKIAVLSGPNHAEEVCRKMPTATVVASKSRYTGKLVCEAFETKMFKVYYVNDLAGVEICAALKNITALATGVCQGLGFGDNAMSAIITLGLTEMNNFGRHFKGKRGTVYGLAGVGDLIATCISKHSRNRFVGENLGKGKSIDQIREEMKGMIAEGIPTTKAVYEYAKKNNIEMPLTTQAYQVLFEGKDIIKSMKDLLNII